MTTTEQTTESVRGALPFATAAFAFLVTMMGTTMPTPIYAFYMQAYGLSQLWVTVIYAIYAGGVVAALLITGTWSDQIGRKPPLFAGLAFALALPATTPTTASPSSRSCSSPPSSTPTPRCSASRPSRRRLATQSIR